MLSGLDIATTARFCQRVNTEKTFDRVHNISAYATHVFNNFLGCRNLCVKRFVNVMVLSLVVVDTRSIDVA
jgi:hypothetical protein